MRIQLSSVLCAAALSCFGSCSSSPSKSEPDSGPDWVRQPARTVDNGYIVYVGSGEDRAPEKAAFKAEAQALGDVANECSFVPKGARIEDRFQREIGVLHQAYAKVAVEFQICEQAKAAVQPADIRALANDAYADEIKEYRTLVAQAESTPAAESPPAPGPSEPTTKVVIRDEPELFWYRQQVVYQKETVILAPSTQYQPGTPQTANFVREITPATHQIHDFEAANPNLKSSPTSFSSHLRTAEPSPHTGPPRMNRGRHNGAVPRGAQHGPRRKRRRRHGEPD